MLKTVYVIRQDTNEGERWLVSCKNNLSAVPTCMWGNRMRNAMVFKTLESAKNVARNIGNCDIVALGAAPEKYNTGVW